MSCTPVLYAEDVPENLELFEQGLAKNHPDVRLQRVKDARDAINYLRDALKPGRFATHPLPKVVVLKTRAPGEDPLVALRWIRGRSELASMPVVVVGSSPAAEEKQRAFKLGADQYIPLSGACPDLVEQLRLWI